VKRQAFAIEPRGPLELRRIRELRRIEVPVSRSGGKASHYTRAGGERQQDELASLIVSLLGKVRPRKGERWLCCENHAVWRVLPAVECSITDWLTEVHERGL
jgi:hypothetical protein